MSVLAKTFEKVLDTGLRAWAERTGVLSDLQGGFREGRGTEDQIFILNEIAAHRRERESPPSSPLLMSGKRTTECGGRGYGAS